MLVYHLVVEVDSLSLGSMLFNMNCLFQNKALHMPMKRLQIARLSCSRQREYEEIDKVILFTQ